MFIQCSILTSRELCASNHFRQEIILTGFRLLSMKSEVKKEDEEETRQTTTIWLKDKRTSHQICSSVGWHYISIGGQSLNMPVGETRPLLVWVWCLNKRELLLCHYNQLCASQLKKTVCLSLIITLLQPTREDVPKLRYEFFLLHDHADQIPSAGHYFGGGHDYFIWNICKI